MALVIKDRVQETTTTTGTGTVTLAGAVLGYSTFSVIGNANTTYYCIFDSGSGAWEAGIGTYTASGTTLSRDTVYANSLGTTALINFGAGPKFVFGGMPANKTVYLDASGNVSALGNVTSGTWSATLGAVSGANLTSLTAGNLTGTIPSAVLGNSTVYVGTTAIALNRASASQSLTGVNIDGSAGSAANLTGGSISGNYTVNNATSPNTYYLQWGDNTGWTYRFMTSVAGTPTARFSFTDQGNLTAVGSVTANSDESLKSNWRPVQDDFVTKLAQVKSGVYDRVDVDLTQAGVSAQSWQKLLPETVQRGDDGILSVAYGNAALVAAVELAKEVVALRQELAELKAKIGG